MKLPEKFLAALQNLKKVNQRRASDRLDIIIIQRELERVVDAAQEVTDEGQQLAALTKLAGLMANFGTARRQGATEDLGHLRFMLQGLKALADEALRMSREPNLSEPIQDKMLEIVVETGSFYRYLNRRSEALNAAYRTRI